MVCGRFYRRYYSLPGGFAGKGKSSEQAARRALREELGIDLSGRTLRHAWNGTLKLESRQDTVDVWEVSMDHAPAVRIAGGEIVWAGWLSPSEVRARPHLPHVATYLVQRH